MSLDCGCIGTVTQAEDCGDDEQGLDAQSLPDPAAEERHKYRNEMVYRYAC